MICDSQKSNFVTPLILEILSFHWESFAIWSVKSIFDSNSDKKFCSTCNLGWEVKNHDHSLFKWFFRKSNYLIHFKLNHLIIIKYPFLAALLKYERKWILCKKLFSYYITSLKCYMKGNKEFYEMTVISWLVGQQRKNWSEKKTRCFYT